MPSSELSSNELTIVVTSMNSRHNVQLKCAMCYTKRASRRPEGDDVGKHFNVYPGNDKGCSLIASLQFAQSSTQANEMHWLVLPIPPHTTYRSTPVVPNPHGLHNELLNFAEPQWESNQIFPPNPPPFLEPTCFPLLLYILLKWLTH